MRLPYSTEYPVEWEADVVLRDGSTTHVRPIRAEDSEALQRFQMAQSERSTYLRFFAALQRIPDRMLTQLVTVDHVSRAALVAVRPGTAQEADGADGADPAEDIVGVARYDVIDDRPGRRTAEVAFNIADALQGQGLGSVLLEHIAAAARERGVHRFTAEVLPQNGAMLGVFREAGYAVEQHLDDGVVTVSVDLDPTDRSREVMADREHRTEARSMQGLLSARRVLLVGPAQGGTVDELLADRVREAHAADPGDTELLVLGTDVAWSDVGTVDLAVVAAPPDEVIDAVRRLRGTGARGVVVLSAGWAETGPDGVARRRELLRTAHAEGMRVVGPASYGLLTNVPGASLRASLALTAPEPGRVGLFSQSSPVAVTAAATVKRRGLGLSTLVSAGHRADVSGNDVMQYWQDDPHTDVACLYLETLGNPRKFSRIARRLAQVKPVVVVVAGRHGSVVPPGHTVRATRAPRRMLDEVLRQSGVIRAENTHQLMDVAQVLAHQPLPTGGRVGVLASSPSLAALVADAVAAAGLTVVGPPDPLSAGAPDDEIAAAVDALYAPGACDAVVVVSVPVVLPRTDAIARAVAEAAARTGRTTVVSALDLHGMPDELASGDVRIPAFSTPEDAVWALGAVVRYAQWRTQDHGTPVRPALREGLSDGAARAQARTLVESLLAQELARGAGPGARRCRPRPCDRRRAAGLLRPHPVELPERAHGGRSGGRRRGAGLAGGAQDRGARAAAPGGPRRRAPRHRRRRGPAGGRRAHARGGGVPAARTGSDAGGAGDGAHRRGVRGAVRRGRAVRPGRVVRAGGRRRRPARRRDARCAAPDRRRRGAHGARCARGAAALRLPGRARRRRRGAGGRARAGVRHGGGPAGARIAGAVPRRGRGTRGGGAARDDPAAAGGAPDGRAAAGAAGLMWTGARDEWDDSPRAPCPYRCP